MKVAAGFDVAGRKLAGEAKTTLAQANLGALQAEGGQK